MIVSGSTSAEPIAKVDVSVYTIPTDLPGSRRHASRGIRRRSCSSNFTRPTARGSDSLTPITATARLIHDKLAAIVLRHDAFDIPAAVAAMRRAIRNLGRPGIASMAISAVDVALWDLKARLLDLPLVSLLGRRSRIRADLRQWRLHVL